MAEAQGALVERWAESFVAGHDAVMLAPSRSDVGMLNQFARAELRRSGQLGPDLLEVEGRVRCRRQSDLSAQRPAPRRVERHHRHRRDVGRAHLAVPTADGPRALPVDYLEAGHLGHAYAMTVHKSQGITVERAFVLSTDSLTQESGYVAMSRATESTELFVPVGSAPMAGPA